MAPPAERWLVAQYDCGTAHVARGSLARSRAGEGVAPDLTLCTRPSADAGSRPRARHWPARVGRASGLARTCAARDCQSVSWYATSSTAGKSSRTAAPPDTARRVDDRRADFKPVVADQLPNDRAIFLFDPGLVIFVADPSASERDLPTVTIRQQFFVDELTTVIRIDA